MGGKIVAEIYLDRVPRTASNFIDLVNSTFYHDLHFHRVIPNYMIQFGCPVTKDPKNRDRGSGAPPDGTFKNLESGLSDIRSDGGKIQDEHISKDSNTKGTLS